MRIHRSMTLSILLLSVAHVFGADSAWEPVSGVWTATASGGNGRSTGGDLGLLLSRQWYGDFEFSGHIQRAPGTTAVLVRYAGPSESYAVILDWRKSRASVQENHFGRSREVVTAPMGALGKEPVVSFHISAKGTDLAITLRPPGRSDSVGLTLALGNLEVPEGRLGLGVRDSELAYSHLDARGQTASAFATYAFHCNSRLSGKVAGEPLWQYLDAVGSSLASRYPRNFRSIEEFEKHRTQALMGVRRSLGLDPWPERTPLNARVTGVVDRPDYKIEKVIFESQPGFLVSALLYLPKKATFPAPGILSTIGHYGDDDFFIWSEQGRCIGLAKKGYVVLTYDPISQGERAWLGAGNHDTLRRKTILASMEVSGLMFWDSIRAIDYLSSRPEVDPSRIGVTGLSGGGFNAIFTAALDPRVRCVAPGGYSTTIEALIKRANAGCCAYLPNLNLYAEMEDIYSFIAPRKLLILGGYMDILSDRILPIFEAARRVYRLYGAEDNIQYFLDRDAGHTYSKPLRLAMYRQFNSWLKDIGEPAEAQEPRDPEDALISKESGLLKVFPPGERGKDVIDLIREYLAKNQAKFEAPSDSRSVADFQEKMRQRLVELMGDIPKVPAPVVESDDRAHGAGSVRRVVLKTERDLPVAVTIHHPANRAAGQALMIYFSMAERYPAVDRFQQAGFTVAVPEVRGAGATRVQDMTSVMLYTMALGKHLFSTRIFDLQKVIDYLLSQPEYRSSRLTVWGEGTREGPMALYLAAIDSRVHVVVNSHGLVSYQDVIDKDGLPDFDYYVPGLLKYADTPQIAAAIAPRRVLLSAPVDIHNRVLEIEEAKKVYAWTENVYRILERPAGFQLLSQSDLLEAIR